MLDMMSNGSRVRRGVNCNSKYFLVSSFMEIALNCGAMIMVALSSGLRCKNKKKKWGSGAGSAVNII